jgi:hypothetical protein
LSFKYQEKGENMKKYTNVLVALVMILLIGCSKEKPEDKENILKQDMSQTEAKKSIESPIATKSKILCDKFDLVTKVTDSTLDLSVDTDLPDNMVVMVDVTRSYLHKGDSTAYIEYYFAEKSTIAKWKSEHSISIADEVWKKALRDRQELVSIFGPSFDVASISDKITVSMTVPINQPDSMFGERNQNLTGKAVTVLEEDLRVVEDEIEIVYPLNAPPIGKSPFPNLDPMRLDIGQSYIVSNKTALMPSHSPEDPLAAIQQMKYVPKNGRFKVHKVYFKDKNNPWYKVTAFNQSMEEIGTGWINSTALLGQQLEVHK